MMTFKYPRNLLAAAPLLLAAAGTTGMSDAAHAGTVTYTGTTSSSVSQSLMPLGNGDSVVTAVTRGIAAMSGEPPVLFEVRCNGMGIVGEDERYSVDFYCNFAENDTDALVLQGTDTVEGGKVKVIGGSGRWKGATGSGSFERVEASETASKSNFKLRITTP